MPSHTTKSLSKKKVNKDPVDINEAKQLFNKYYEKKHKHKGKSVIKKAKLFDALYEKKQQYTLKPNTDTSWKYRLKRGVETFDMEGVDSFPEGTPFNINGQIKYSKGASFLKDTDAPGSVAYGPRGDKNKGALYSEIFREDELKHKTKGRRQNKKQLHSPRTNKKLIEIYWEKFNHRKLITSILRDANMSEADIQQTMNILSKHYIKWDNDL